MTDVTTVDLTAATQEPFKKGYKLILRLDSPEGRILGETTLKIEADREDAPFISIPASIKVDPVTDGKLHNLYVVTEPVEEEENPMVLVNIELKAD